MARQAIRLLLALTVLTCGIGVCRSQSEQASGATAAATHEHLAASTSAASPLKVVEDIELPGPTNRFDYQTYDAALHRLFIAHLGAGTVVAFDTELNKVVGVIPNTAKVHGVLAVSPAGRLYVSATGTNEIVVIDSRTLKEIARIPGGTYPDGMAYVPELHKLYVSDETGKTETVIDTNANARTKTIPLQGEVGNTQYDPTSKHVFVNVQSLEELVEIDPQTDTIVARHHLAEAKGNHGLLIDAGQRLAYIACEGNARLLVFDLDSKQVVASYPVGDTPDVLALDERLGWLYVASESGIVTVFRQEGRTLRKLSESFLAKRAHTVAVDSQTHRVYFPLENVEGRAVLRIMEALEK